MPSITTWNRLEPRPRAASLSLAARIRDPLWMLARQTQFREFAGADSGSPAFVQLRATQSRLAGWRVEGETSVRPFGGGDPLEDVVLSEPSTPDLALRVELGQVFATLVAQKVSLGLRRDELLAGLRRAYALPPLPGSPAGAVLVKLATTFRQVLNRPADPIPTSLLEAFANAGLLLSNGTAVTVLESDNRWRLDDPGYDRRYLVTSLEPAEAQLAVNYAAPNELADDYAAVRFHEVCAGRSIDGVAVYRAAHGKLPILPATVAGAEAADLRDAAERLRQWVAEVYGDLGSADAAGWKPERLEYRMEAVATAPDGGVAYLAADPGRNGGFDWDAFDLRSNEAGAGPTESIRFSVIPGHVRFAGMPNARFWDFETGTTAFGEIRPDKRDLAKLVMMDFMLVHGNDWFIVPLEQPIGTLCRIDSLVVRDVFGVDTLVERADARPVAPGELWSMFSTAVEAQPHQVADFFVLPPSPGAAAQIGPTLEEVRFLRDEMANLVWAVEHTTENGVGEPWPGHERELARRPPAAGAVAVSSGAPALQYRLKTEVLEHWIPFLPVTVDPSAGDVRLERSSVPRATTGEDVPPSGRILRPKGLGTNQYRIFEEEVPREGVRVSRIVARSRWTDGSTHVWIARRKEPGRGEGSSGLRFDLVVLSGQPISH